LPLNQKKPLIASRNKMQKIQIGIHTTQKKRNYNENRTTPGMETTSLDNYYARSEIKKYDLVDISHPTPR
jgi:hypothetical protein